MADVHGKKTRSYKMSQIKGKNIKPEMPVRKITGCSAYEQWFFLIKKINLYQWVYPYTIAEK
jgi:hypothetical protein